MRSSDRQATRRSIASLTALGVLVLAGVAVMLSLLGRLHQKAAELFHDPVLALHGILAPHETRWRWTHPRYATLEELVKEGDVSDELLEGPVEGFRFKVVVADEKHFWIEASPEGPEPPPRAGHKIRYCHYAVDETHTVRSDPARVTTASLVEWNPRDNGVR